AGRRTRGRPARRLVVLVLPLAPPPPPPHPPGPAPPPPAPPPPPATLLPDSRASLARGKQRYESYKCFECHGRNGEGTDDAPDLTHSKLTAAEIAAFLTKPSAHARSIGMPSIPPDSPDIQPLVPLPLPPHQPHRLLTHL